MSVRMSTWWQRLQHDPAGTAVAFVAILARPRTYLRLIYLALALPLGSAYLSVLVLGLFVGASLTVIGVGILILLGCMLVAWVFALFERELVIRLLGVEVPPLTLPNQVPLSSPRRLIAHLRRPTTWKSIAYLALMVPFGAFVYGVGMLVVIAPTALLIQAANHLLEWGSVLLAPALLMLVTGLHIMDAIATGWGRFASSSLGIGAEERRAWEAERRAIAAERGRRELILSVSHELRTPIASIQGHLDSLLLPEGQRPPPDQWERYITVAAGESRRLGRLIDELLMLSRADADQLAIAMAPVEVAPLLRRVAAAMEPLARNERRVTLVCRPSDGLVAQADPNRLTQVVTNLLRNAITHTPEGGAVSVESLVPPDAVPGTVAIRVTDTGAGIASQDLPRVFDRFFRADASRSRDSGGFGLGLAIARDLVEKMGGSIGVSSQAGLGSTFEVRLRAVRR